jgi:hypothetical protein
MGVGKIRASTSGSLDKLKRDLKDSGNGDWFYRLPGDAEITLRFMAEPWDFVKYTNHYDRDAKQSYPCVEGDCKGCDEGIEGRQTWVAPVVDVTESRVRAMVIPKGVVDSLTKRAEKRGGTIMDRDFIIMREGTTMEDTKYEIEPQPPKRRNMSDYEPPDIMDMLEQQLRDAMDDDDDDDEPPRRSSSKKASKKAARKTARPTRRAALDDDDDDDDEPRSSTGRARKRRSLADDGDDKPPRRSLKKAVKKTAPKKSLRRR